MKSRPIREILLDPRVLTLAAILTVTGGLIYFFGPELAPFVLALVLAFHLDAGVSRLRAWGWSQRWSLTAVFGGFLVIYFAGLLGPLQFVMRRAIRLAGQIQREPDRIGDMLRELSDSILGLIPDEQRQEVVAFLVDQTSASLDYIFSHSISWIPRFTGWLVYLFVVPIVVFFFLKDKKLLLQGIARCLPQNLQLVDQVWGEMVLRMGNYIRGKIWEIIIVAVVTWLAFVLLGFQYPAVMGMVSGISVLIPYVGAIGVAAPVFVLGYLQWGLGWDLGWLMLVYTVIQMIDGNVLVPMIFSEAVKLHPVVILLAVFIFGSMLGLWGVFFAIPLATLAKSLIVTLLDFRDRRAA